MIENKKGFSLIELLVVIAIIGVILLISFPMVDNLIKKNGRTKYDAYRNVIEEAAKEYMDDLGFIVSGCYEIKTEEQSSYEVLESEGLLSNFNEDCKDTKVYVISDEKGNIIDYKINLVCDREDVLDKEYTSDTCDYKIVQYKDSYGGNTDASNANTPKMVRDMVPVKYDGERWIVADSDNIKVSSIFEESYAWHDYNNKYWANAVILNTNNLKKTKGKYNPGQEIEEDNVKTWWVWMPRFVGNSTSDEIEFVSNLSQGDPNEDGEYNVNEVFDKTHNKVGKDLHGIWINKYTTTASTKTLDGLYTKDYNTIRKYNSHTMDYSTLVALNLFTKAFGHYSKIKNTIYSTTGNESGVYFDTSMEEVIGYVSGDIVNFSNTKYRVTYQEPSTTFPGGSASSNANHCGDSYTCEKFLCTLGAKYYTLYCILDDTNACRYYANKDAEVYASIENRYKELASSGGSSKCTIREDIDYPLGKNDCYFKIERPLYPSSALYLGYKSGTREFFKDKNYYKYLDFYTQTSFTEELVCSSTYSGGPTVYYYDNDLNKTVNNGSFSSSMSSSITYKYTTSYGDENTLSKLVANNKNTSPNYGVASSIKNYDIIFNNATFSYSRPVMYYDF